MRADHLTESTSRPALPTLPVIELDEAANVVGRPDLVGKFCRYNSLESRVLVHAYRHRRMELCGDNPLEDPRDPANEAGEGGGSTEDQVLALRTCGTRRSSRAKVWPSRSTSLTRVGESGLMIGDHRARKESYCPQGRSIVRVIRTGAYPRFRGDTAAVSATSPASAAPLTNTARGRRTWIGRYSRRSCRGATRPPQIRLAIRLNAGRRTQRGKLRTCGRASPLSIECSAARRHCH